MLYVRDVERARVGELLDRARGSRGGALVIRGEPGVGKSALLADARGRAGEMAVLSAAGVESEARLPFAAVHQLLLPVLGFVEGVPEPQAAALRVALGLEYGAAADRFLVSLAVLSLLAGAAEHGPLLCLVDDAHWLDDASADALVFAARRIQEERVAMLFAVREGMGARVQGLPELRLGGLDREAAAALLDRRTGVALPADSREGLLAAGGGNPLALLELPAALSERQRSGADPLLVPPPLGARLERAFLARVRELEQDAQTVLLVAAAEDSGELSVVLPAAARLGARADALDGAERAGLARVRGTRVELHHPLVRSALYHAAPLSRRRTVHRALADVLDGEPNADRRAWHRAAASVEPDPGVADELERAAERARGRSGYAAAALALERAAVLSDERAAQARRLISATENAWLGGRLERASALLERARAVASGALQRADADRCAGLIEMTSGDQAQACRLLMRAAGEVGPGDGERALRLLSIARILATHTGDEAAGVAIGELARAAPGNRPSARVLRQSLLGFGAHAAGDFTAARSLRRAVALQERHEDALAGDPMALLLAGRAAVFLGDDRADHRIHVAAVARTRASGALSLLTQALVGLGYAELSAGHWSLAAAHATEGLRLARDIGQDQQIAYLLALSGRAGGRWRPRCSGRCSATTSARSSACSRPRSPAMPTPDARSSAPARSWRSASFCAAQAARPRPGSTCRRRSSASRPSGRPCGPSGGGPNCARAARTSLGGKRPPPGRGTRPD